MKDINFINKYSVEDLKKVKCYLTFEGAVKSNVCEEALEIWEHKYNKRKMEAKELVKNFLDLCPYYWAARILGGKYMIKRYTYNSFVYYPIDKMCPIYSDDCGCDDCYIGRKSISFQKKQLVLIVRAAIIKLCEMHEYNKEASKILFNHVMRILEKRCTGEQ